jgi:hypothetical protein
MILTGETEKFEEKTCPSATLSATNPTWTEPGLSVEMPTTDRLSHSQLIYRIITERMGEERKVYKVLLGKAKGKRPLV